LQKQSIDPRETSRYSLASADRKDCREGRKNVRRLDHAPSGITRTSKTDLSENPRPGKVGVIRKETNYAATFFINKANGEVSQEVRSSTNLNEESRTSLNKKD